MSLPAPVYPQQQMNMHQKLVGKDIDREVNEQLLTRAEYRLLDLESDYVRDVSVGEVFVLSHARFIVGLIYREGQNMTQVKLTVPTHRAYRLLDSIRVGSNKIDRTISKNRTAPGAIHWKERLDRADGGTCAGLRTLHLNIIDRGKEIDSQRAMRATRIAKQQRIESLRELIGSAA